MANIGVRSQLLILVGAKLLLQVSGSGGQLAGLGRSEAAGVPSYQHSDRQAFHMS
jgi:hypothetical protein